MKSAEARGGVDIEDAIELLEELGFDPVPLDEPGAPTPERVSRCLARLVDDLRDSLLRKDARLAMAACRELDRLATALARYPVVLARLDAEKTACEMIPGCSSAGLLSR
jgi:hypothetical protein